MSSMENNRQFFLPMAIVRIALSTGLLSMGRLLELV